MTQPDDWTQDATDALGDLAYDKIVAERDSIKVKWQATWASLEVVTNDAVRFLARAEAAEADARECRAERARYSDAMTERLADAEAERDALRVRCIEWLPFSEAAETIDSILVWREDAGVFVAFYADEQECWFTSFGEDLTGDLPTFYAKMPKGPTSK